VVEQLLRKRIDRERDKVAHDSKGSCMDSGGEGMDSGGEGMDSGGEGTVDGLAKMWRKLRLNRLTTAKGMLQEAGLDYAPSVRAMVAQTLDMGESMELHVTMSGLVVEAMLWEIEHVLDRVVLARAVQMTLERPHQDQRVVVGGECYLPIELIGSIHLLWVWRRPAWTEHGRGGVAEHFRLKGWLTADSGRSALRS
jgi:hypothetical protein